MTALMLASSLGDGEGVRFLLADSRIDPNLQRHSRGFTALMFASFKGYTKIVEELLKHPKTNAALRNSKGLSALDLACEDPDAVQSQKALIIRLIEEKLGIIRSIDSWSLSTSLEPIVEVAVPSDVFISHNWGKNAENHKKVAHINQGLKAKGLITWFDEDRMRGNVRKKMALGIENTKCMLVCVTEEYKNKVNGDENRDNCYYEFTYGVEQLGPQRMISLVMEPSMRSPRDWKGELGAALGKKLYHDFQEGPENPEQFNHLIDQLYEEIVEMIKK